MLRLQQYMPRTYLTRESMSGIDVNDIIKRDKALNPSCSYSVSKSTSLSNNGSQSIYKIVEEIQRHCPHERPRIIHSSSMNSDAAPESLDNVFPGFGVFEGGMNSFWDGLMPGLDIFGLEDRRMPKIERRFPPPKPYREKKTERADLIDGEIIGPSESI